MPDCPTCGQDFDEGADMFDVIRHTETCAIAAKAAGDEDEGIDLGFPDDDSDYGFDQHVNELYEESWGQLQDR